LHVAVADPADCSRADGEGRKAVRRGATEAWWPPPLGFAELRRAGPSPAKARPSRARRNEPVKHRFSGSSSPEAGSDTATRN